MARTAVADDETTLVERARAGDLAAFTELVRAYQARIRAYVGAQVRDPALADDLAQDVFVRAHAGLRALEHAAALKGWLFGIARNRVLEHLREAARRAVDPADPAAVLDRLRLEVLTGAADTAFQDRLEALQKCLETLPASASALVRRHYFDGETLASLAASHEKNEGTIRMKIFRIRSALRACIEARVAEGAPRP